MHFIQCTTRHLQAGHIKRRGELNHIHGKLCKANVIYDGFMRIFILLRCGDTSSSTVTHFDLAIDKLVERDWEE